jgi:hypothetical protein
MGTAYAEIAFKNAGVLPKPKAGISLLRIRILPSIPKQEFEGAHGDETVTFIVGIKVSGD